MTENDGLKLQVDFEFNKNAIVKQVDDISKLIGERLGQKAKAKTITHQNGVFSELVYDGKEYTKVLYEIDKATNKITKATKQPIERKDIQGYKEVEVAIKRQIELEQKLAKVKANALKKSGNVTFADLTVNQERAYANYLASVGTPSETIAMQELIEARNALQNYNLEKVKEVQATKKATKETEKNTKANKDNEKSTKKRTSVLGKLARTIGRVSYYKVARSILQQISNMFTQGITSLAEFDKQANTTFSGFATAFEKIKASVALSITPILEAILPIVNDITASITDFANNISMASSAMKGSTKYTKINDEYIKDMAENANKMTASFDKFETLNGKESPYVEAEMTHEEIEKSQEWAKKLEGVQSVIKGIWSFIKEQLIPLLKDLWDIFKPVLADIWDILVAFIDWLSKGNNLKIVLIAIAGIIAGITLSKIISSLSKINVLTMGIVLLVTGLVEMVKAIWDITNWDEQTSGTKKFLDVLRVVLSVITVIAAVMAMMMKGTLTGKIAAGIAVVATVGTLIASASAQSQQVKAYADGGMVDRGTLFVAGESGAEVVAQMPSGQTGVTNVAQFQQAMVNALYECADIFQQPQGDVVVDIDGAEVARSKRFTSEMNRRNSGFTFR